MKTESLKVLKNKYTPIKGFYDLRNYNIPNNKIFKTLWETQETLKRQQDLYFSLSKENQKANKLNWDNLKKLSALYQHELFKYSIIQPVGNPD